MNRKDEKRDNDRFLYRPGIAARGAGVGANRTLALASMIFNFGVSKEVLDLNPAYRVLKPGKESSRSRELRDDEIPAVWRALDGEPKDIAALFKLLLLTAQRRGEVKGMRWAELHLAAGWWEIPGERTKNGRTHRVPIVGRALEILRELQARRRDPEYVFPGHRAHQPLVNLAKPLARVIKRSGVELFTLHDLRRTAATRLARAGIAGPVIAEVLNHVTGANGVSRMTMIYDRYQYDREKREALLKLDQHLATLIGESRATAETSIQSASST